MSAPDEHITSATIAALLRISPSYGKELIRTIPGAFKLGDKPRSPWRVSLSDFNAWREARIAKSAKAA